MRGSSAFARSARGTRARGGRVDAARSLARPSPPCWVSDWLGDTSLRALGPCDGTALELHEGASCGFARAVVRDARSLDACALRRGVERAYRELAAQLDGAALRPLRIWNYVPAIRARGPDGLSRYEVFNQGRHRVVSEWLAAPDLEGRLPAASAIDHHGADLEVHVLAGREAGVALENPRQTPAWRYSKRYGPRPPCFARALRVHAPNGGAAVALVSGTASIVGEESRHEGDLPAQLEETFANLAALAASVPLLRYRALRVYVVRPEDAAEVARWVRRALTEAESLELFHADVCRPELLVEIEALADAAP